MATRHRFFRVGPNDGRRRRKSLPRQGRRPGRLPCHWRRSLGVHPRPPRPAVGRVARRSTNCSPAEQCFSLTRGSPGRILPACHTPPPPPAPPPVARSSQPPPPPPPRASPPACPFAAKTTSPLRRSFAPP